MENLLPPEGLPSLIALARLFQIMPFLIVCIYGALGFLGGYLLATALENLRTLYSKLRDRLAAIDTGLRRLEERFNQAEAGRTSATSRLLADIGAVGEAVTSLSQRNPAAHAPPPLAGAVKTTPMGAEERQALLKVAELAATRARQRELPASTIDLSAATAALHNLWRTEIPELVALHDRWPGRSDKLLQDARHAVQEGNLVAASRTIHTLLQTVDLPVVGEKEAARMVVAAVLACASKDDGSSNAMLLQLTAAWKMRQFTPRAGDEFDPARHRTLKSVKGTPFDHRQIVKVERPGYLTLSGEVVEQAWVQVGG